MVVVRPIQAEEDSKIDKTDDAHGPAHLVFSIALYNWFQIFIDNIRGRFYGISKTGSTPVFVAHMHPAVAHMHPAG